MGGGIFLFLGLCVGDVFSLGKLIFFGDFIDLGIVGEGNILGMFFFSFGWVRLRVEGLISGIFGSFLDCFLGGVEVGLGLRDLFVKLEVL